MNASRRWADADEIEFERYERAAGGGNAHIEDVRRRAARTQLQAEALTERERVHGNGGASSFAAAALRRGAAPAAQTKLAPCAAGRRSSSALARSTQRLALIRPSRRPRWTQSRPLRQRRTDIQPEDHKNAEAREAARQGHAKERRRFLQSAAPRVLSTLEPNERALVLTWRSRSLTSPSTFALTQFGSKPGTTARAPALATTAMGTPPPSRLRRSPTHVPCQELSSSLQGTVRALVSPAYTPTYGPIIPMIQEAWTAGLCAIQHLPYRCRGSSGSSQRRATAHTSIPTTSNSELAWRMQNTDCVKQTDSWTPSAGRARLSADRPGEPIGRRPTIRCPEASPCRALGEYPWVSRCRRALRRRPPRSRDGSPL